MRTAIVGAGAISAVHVKALLSQGRRVDFICDTDAEKARALNERFSLNAEIYTDYETLIESGKVDVAHICTPHFLHAPMVVRALGKGVHVLCEKPLCICEEELREILRAEKHSSARLGVCFQNRYNASTEYVINALKARKITAAAARFSGNAARNIIIARLGGENLLRREARRSSIRRYTPSICFPCCAAVSTTLRQIISTCRCKRR